MIFHWRKVLQSWQLITFSWVSFVLSWTWRICFLTQIRFPTSWTVLRVFQSIFTGTFWRWYISDDLSKWITFWTKDCIGVSPWRVYQRGDGIFSIRGFFSRTWGDLIFISGLFISSVTSSTLFWPWLQHPWHYLSIP